MSIEKESQNLDSSDLILFLWKWRKPILSVTFFTVVVSAIVSLLIQEKYLSTVILYPAKVSSVSKAILAQNSAGQDDVLKMGEEEEAEQLLQILHSDEIRDKIARKYNLLKHYEIKDDEKFKMTKLSNEYENNITFTRTEFQSIRIDVLDKHPDTAALIANDIAALLDSVKSRMLKERATEILKVVGEEYIELKEFLKSISDSLTGLRKLGIHEYEVQVEMYTNQYSKAIIDRKFDAADMLDEKLKLLAEHGSKYVRWRDILIQEQERLSHLRAKYEEAKVDATRNVPHKFIVNRAFPAEKKKYPIRWLIVAISTISVLLVTIFVALAVENYQQLQKKTTSQ